MKAYLSIKRIFLFTVLLLGSSVAGAKFINT